MCRKKLCLGINWIFKWLVTELIHNDRNTFVFIPIAFIIPIYSFNFLWFSWWPTKDPRWIIMDQCNGRRVFPFSVWFFHERIFIVFEERFPGRMYWFHCLRICDNLLFLFPLWFQRSFSHLNSFSFPYSLYKITTYFYSPIITISFVHTHVVFSRSMLIGMNILLPLYIPVKYNPIS